MKRHMTCKMSKKYHHLGWLCIWISWWYYNVWTLYFHERSTYLQQKWTSNWAKYKYTVKTTSNWTIVCIIVCINIYVYVYRILRLFVSRCIVSNSFIHLFVSNSFIRFFVSRTFIRLSISYSYYSYQTRLFVSNSFIRLFI